MNIRLRLLSCAAFGLVACGAGKVVGSPQVTVAVRPSSAELGPSESQAFTAGVTGSTDTAVTWTVQEAAGGTIDSAGNYTAPSAPGVFHVVATSSATPSVSGTATVTVTTQPPATVSITVLPGIAGVQTGGTFAFLAVVTGSTDTAVSWAVAEGAPGGTIDATGLYTAPSTTGTYHIVATSHADSSKSQTATVNVSATQPAGAIAISGPTTVDPGIEQLVYTITLGASNVNYIAAVDYDETCEPWYNDSGSGCMGNGPTPLTPFSENPDAFGQIAIMAPRNANPFHLTVTQYTDSTYTTALAQGRITIYLAGSRYPAPNLGAQISDASQWYKVPTASRVRYLTGRIQSPATTSVTSGWRYIVQHADLSNSFYYSFAKIGDSISLSSHAALGDDLNPCLAMGQYLTNTWRIFNITDLEASEATNHPQAYADFNFASVADTVYHFRSYVLTAVDQTGSPVTSGIFDRFSIATVPGSKVGDQTTGDPSNATTEETDIHSLFSMIQFGTNDNNGTGPMPNDQLASTLRTFVTNLLAYVDSELALGHVPIIIAPPPRLDAVGEQWFVPQFVTAARGVAEARQVPFVDLYYGLISSPYLTAPSSVSAISGWGIGSDGVHLETSGNDELDCHYNLAGLTGNGAEHRNLMLVHALDRLTKAVVLDASSFDATGSALAGSGTSASPYVLDLTGSEPILGATMAAFEHEENASGFPGGTVNYACPQPPNSGTAGATSTTGPRVIYSLSTATSMPVRFIVNDGATAVHNLYLLDSQGHCLASGASQITATMPAGSYTLSIDSISGTTADYVLTAVECDPADTRCSGAVTPGP
jgi:hypothetical protein